MELIVSSGLVVLLMGLVWMLLQAGSRFYLKVRAQSDLQRNALLSLRWLGKDLSEGASRAFRHYDPDNPTVVTDRNGIVFASPKNLDDEVLYDSSGRLLWTSMIGYYIDPESGDFRRAKILTADQPSSAPQIQDSLHHIEILAESPHQRLIARKAEDLNIVHGIRDIEVELKFRDEDLGFGLTVKTKLEMRNT